MIDRLKYMEEKKVIVILSVFLLIFNSLLGQNHTQKVLECEFYYDTILQKDVYQTVEIFPSYDKGGIENFVEKIIQEIKKKEIVISQEEALRNSRIIVTFIVNERGYLDNIQIDKKKEEVYSNIDKEVLKIVDKLSCKKWNPGLCNNKKVATRVFIPIRIEYRH